jgi:excisionase family DNA binding protein
MSALQDEIKAAVREVVREEVRTALAELRPVPASSDGPLVGVREAARLLGLSTSTVYKRAESCELPSVKAGSRVLFRPADLSAYAEARRRSPELVSQLATNARRP